MSTGFRDWKSQENKYSSDDDAADELKGDVAEEEVEPGSCGTCGHDYQVVHTGL